MCMLLQKELVSARQSARPQHHDGSLQYAYRFPNQVNWFVQMNLLQYSTVQLLLDGWTFQHKSQYPVKELFSYVTIHGQELSSRILFKLQLNRNVRVSCCKKNLVLVSAGRIHKTHKTALAFIKYTLCQQEQKRAFISPQSELFANKYRPRRHIRNPREKSLWCSFSSN